MYGATGTYMLGSFDGKVFTPEAGKYCYTTGSIYAAQTYNNIPASDGRRIQIGWGRVSHPGMPFNGMMMLPTELTLRTTKDGIRLVSVPVRETESLFTPVHSWKSLTSDEANRNLKEFYDADCGTVYVNIGSQFHAGRVLRRVEMAVQRIGVHVVANHSLSEQVKARIGGVRQLDSCLDAKTIGIIKFFQVAVCLVRCQRFP